MVRLLGDAILGMIVYEVVSVAHAWSSGCYAHGLEIMREHAHMKRAT